MSHMAKVLLMAKCSLTAQKREGGGSALRKKKNLVLKVIQRFT